MPVYFNSDFCHLFFPLDPKHHPEEKHKKQAYSIANTKSKGNSRDEKMWRVVLDLANQRKKSATLMEMKPIRNWGVTLLATRYIGTRVWC
jgi:hypothetical protein